VILEHDPVATRVLEQVVSKTAMRGQPCKAEYIEGSEPMRWRLTIGQKQTEMYQDRELDWDGMLRAMTAAMKYALGQKTRHNFKERRCKR
jgi:hypothetical protein